jgi:hypothetical protein
MKSMTLILTCVLLLVVTSKGQQLEADTPTVAAPVRYDLPVPEVRINDQTTQFQASLYPGYYLSHPVRSDMRWVRENDSALAAFWQNKGDSVLWLLAQLSGLDWVEDRFDIYVLKYYPSFGGPDPLVLPLGGMREGERVIAAPEGAAQQFNLIYRLAHRMLIQAVKADDPFYRSVAAHPLMQPGPYRRDNLALLLTLVTSQHLIGLDSTFEVYQSPFWKELTPGREVFEKYLLNTWLLTTEKPLARWIVNESPVSPLVEATRPPRFLQAGEVSPGESLEGLPLRGQLGFSVELGENGRLTVNQIDSTRLAYACGLRAGDIIRIVRGRRPSNHKEIVELILEGLDRGGATMLVLRNGEDKTVLIQPRDLANDSAEDGALMLEQTRDSLDIE